MNFSTLYLVAGTVMLIMGLILSVNGYAVIGFLMPIIIVFFVAGLLLMFFEHLLYLNQKKIPSYEEILKIYNKMLENGKREKTKTRRKRATKKKP